jgi:hypothetical protein
VPGVLLAVDVPDAGRLDHIRPTIGDLDDIAGLQGLEAPGQPVNTSTIIVVALTELGQRTESRAARD